MTFRWCISAEPAEIVLWPPSSPGAYGDIRFPGTLRPCTQEAVLPGSAGSPGGVILGPKGIRAAALTTQEAIKAASC